MRRVASLDKKQRACFLSGYSTKRTVCWLLTCVRPRAQDTQLGESLHPDGVVVANEPVSGRLNMLVSNRSRLGLTNIVVTQHDGRHFARLPPPGFDAVVADVPCTGTGTRAKPRCRWDWTPKEVAECSRCRLKSPCGGFPVGPWWPLGVLHVQH